MHAQEDLLKLATTENDCFFSIGTIKHMAKKTAEKNTAKTLDSILSLHFGTEMRKHLVESTLQDIKGFIDSKTDGLVEVTYEDYALKGQEFGFKMHVSRGPKCSKQMYFDAAAAVVNAVSYAFQGDAEQYDVATFAEDNSLEVVFTSNW